MKSTHDVRLTPKMRAAIELMRECAEHDDGWAVVCTNDTASFDGQAWIHWRTAEALVKRDLAHFDDDYLGCVRLHEHDPEFIVVHVGAGI